MRFAFATTLWYQEGCKPKTAQELATIRFTSWGGCSESLGFPDGFLVCISVEPPISTSQPVESSWHQRQMADRPAFQSSLPGLCLACSGLLRPLCINSRLETLESCSATQNKKYKNRDNGNILLYLSLSRTSTAFRTFLFPSILTFGAHLLSLWETWPVLAKSKRTQCFSQSSVVFVSFWFISYHVSTNFHSVFIGSAPNPFQAWIWCSPMDQDWMPSVWSAIFNLFFLLVLTISIRCNEESLCIATYCRLFYFLFGFVKGEKEAQLTTLITGWHIHRPKIVNQFILGERKITLVFRLIQELVNLSAWLRSNTVF